MVLRWLVYLMQDLSNGDTMTLDQTVYSLNIAINFAFFLHKMMNKQDTSNDIDLEGK